jgi:hypothetical protein
MTKKKFIEWLSRIGDDNTKIFFWDIGGSVLLEIQGAIWQDERHENVSIVLEKAPPGHV